MNITKDTIKTTTFNVNFVTVTIREQNDAFLSLVINNHASVVAFTDPTSVKNLLATLGAATNYLKANYSTMMEK